MPARTGTLVFHHNGIGDYVMSLPAVRLLARCAPKPVHLVYGGMHAAFLYDEFEDCRHTRIPFFNARFRHPFRDGEVPLHAAYEYFVSLASWDGPELRRLAQRASARTSIGFFPWCSMRLEDQPLHDMQQMFGLASAFAPPGALMSDFGAPIPFGPEVQSLRTTLVPAGARLLLVHADTQATKMWPCERYDPVIAAFLEQSPDWYVAALNFKEAQLPRALASGRVRIVSGVSLPVAMRLVSEADLFLGIDSCMLHVADLARVPGVALFGPTRADRSGYHFVLEPFARNIQSESAMEDIAEAEVLTALTETQEFAHG